MIGKWELLKINITSNINASMDYNNVIEVVKNASGPYDVISASGHESSVYDALVRRSMAADTLKSCYKNGLTTGTRIDGDIISLDAIEKWCPLAVIRFRDALRERRDYRSGSLDFRGYDGSLWLTVVVEDDNFYRKGDVVGGFSKEYRGCANGYYYSLINDEHFIGTDID